MRPRKCSFSRVAIGSSVLLGLCPYLSREKSSAPRGWYVGEPPTGKAHLRWECPCNRSSAYDDGLTLCGSPNRSGSTVKGDSNKQLVVHTPSSRMGRHSRSPSPRRRYDDRDRERTRDGDRDSSRRVDDPESDRRRRDRSRSLDRDSSRRKRDRSRSRDPDRKEKK
jgi:hypothetical protein